MSTTRLPSALREALGPPAADDLLTIVDEMRAERVEFRDEMRADRAEFRTEFAEFRREVNARFQALDIRLGDVKADLIKWSFVFWVGAVAAIAMLAGVLER